MEKKTYEEIITILEEKLCDENIDSNEFEECEYGSIQRFDQIYKFDDKIVKYLGVGQIKEMIDGRQGGSDAGSNYIRVYYFIDHNIYIQIKGYYSSYEGTSFDGGWKHCSKQVTPQQETITVYK